MDKLCLWRGFLVDDVSHIVCYCLIISGPVTANMTRSPISTAEDQAILQNDLNNFCMGNEKVD